jgi:hypothetical protein
LGYGSGSGGSGEVEARKQRTYKVIEL